MEIVTEPMLTAMLNAFRLGALAAAVAALVLSIARRRELAKLVEDDRASHEARYEASQKYVKGRHKGAANAQQVTARLQQFEAGRDAALKRGLPIEEARIAGAMNARKEAGPA